MTPVSPPRPQPVPDATDEALSDAIAQVLDGQLVPDVAFQPIVDLKRGCAAGYEALARFPGPRASPDRWFNLAASLGLGMELEFVTTQVALRYLGDLPPNTFLTINVTPAMLASERWEAVLAPYERLDRLVVEVTEHEAINDYEHAKAAREHIRARGALFAVDDAGSGYASMQHVLALRPDFVKLDRLFITDCDRDQARVALVEAMGNLASRLDAWVIAEGVERREELECLVRLGTPLAQGWFLGKPGPAWAEPLPDARALLEAQRRRASDRDGLGTLIETTRVSREQGADPAADGSLVLDAYDRPLRWALPGLDAEAARPLVVKAVTPCKAAALRAMARPPGGRFLPLVCSDEEGRYVGIVRVERLVEALARR